MICSILTVIRLDQVKINNKDLILLFNNVQQFLTYDNNLCDELIATGYDTWKSYLANGFPEIPTDPADTPDNGGTDQGGDNSNTGDTGNGGQC